MLDTRVYQPAFPLRVDMQRILNTQTKELIAAYLHSYPSTYDLLSGYARRLSLPVTQLKVAFDELVEADLLLRMGHGANALYALNTRAGWADQLRIFFNEHPQGQKSLSALFANLL